MEIKSISKKILFRSYFIALLIYNKKYKMVANFINKIGKENLNEIKILLDSSIIKPEYQKQFIPMDMLIKFLDDKEIHDTTTLHSRIINIVYLLFSLFLIFIMTYLFPIKNIENLSEFFNICIPFITAIGLWGLYSQLPYLLRSAFPVYFLNNEIKDISLNVIEYEPGQMTIYRDLINNLNRILDKEEGIPSVQNWLLDNSFEKKAQDLKVIEENMQKIRGMLDNSARVLKHRTIVNGYKIIEKDFKFCNSLKGYILVKRSSQKNKSKHKPELIYNVLHSLKNVILANQENEVDLKLIKAFYESLLTKIIEECESKNLYTELFQISFESYISENVYIFSIFQEITMKKGLNYEIIFQRMKDKYLETSIKVLGYLLNKIDGFLAKVNDDEPDLFESLEVRVNILKASIPEVITNRAIELWNEEIV